MRVVAPLSSLSYANSPSRREIFDDGRKIEMFFLDRVLSFCPCTRRTFHLRCVFSSYFGCCVWGPKNDREVRTVRRGLFLFWVLGLGVGGRATTRGFRIDVG